MNKSLAELAEFLGKIPLHGDEKTIIKGVCTAGETSNDKITFATSEKWLRKIDPANVGAVILPEKQDIPGLNQLVHTNPYLAFIRIVELFYPDSREHTGIAGLVDIEADASVGSPVTIKACCVVGSRTIVGNGCILEPGVKLGRDVVLGENCHLHANVVVEDGCILGDNVTIHAGTVIGADGFGYLQHQGKNVKVPQVGKVIVGNDVEIGANCCIDRGTINDTILGNGVVLDNLVQIGHNVVIGDNAVIVAQVGLAGSCTIGRGAMLGGKSGATEHVEIGDGALLAAQAIATRKIPAGTMVAGNPAVEIETWRRSKVIQRKLPAIWSKLQKIINETR